MDNLELQRRIEELGLAGLSPKEQIQALKQKARELGVFEQESPPTPTTTPKRGTGLLIDRFVDTPMRLLAKMPGNLPLAHSGMHALRRAAHAADEA